MFTATFSKKQSFWNLFNNPQLLKENVVCTRNEFNHFPLDGEKRSAWCPKNCLWYTPYLHALVKEQKIIMVILALQTQIDCFAKPDILEIWTSNFNFILFLSCLVEQLLQDPKIPHTKMICCNSSVNPPWSFDRSLHYWPIGEWPIKFNNLIGQYTMKSTDLVLKKEWNFCALNI